MDYAQKAKQIIAENIYMTLSTASLNGEPWVSPVFFAYDDQYNLYWVSNKEARHSVTLVENPRVAVVMFNSQAPEGKGDGVYFSCSVSTLTDSEEITKAIDLYNARASQKDFQVPSPDLVTGVAAWRLYKATPLKIFTLTEGTEVSGQYVDERVDITGDLRNY